MSTKFGIPKRKVPIELGDEDGIFDYINEDFFIEVAFRGNKGQMMWLNFMSKALPDSIRVYALDNSHQGIYTIGDIRKEIKKQ